MYGGESKGGGGGYSSAPAPAPAPAPVIMTYSMPSAPSYKGSSNPAPMIMSYSMPSAPSYSPAPAPAPVMMSYSMPSGGGYAPAPAPEPVMMSYSMPAQMQSYGGGGRGGGGGYASASEGVTFEISPMPQQTASNQLGDPELAAYASASRKRARTLALDGSRISPSELDELRSQQQVPQQDLDYDSKYDSSPSQSLDAIDGINRIDGVSRLADSSINPPAEQPSNGNQLLPMSTLMAAAAVSGSTAEATSVSPFDNIAERRRRRRRRRR